LRTAQTAIRTACIEVQTVHIPVGTFQIGIWTARTTVWTFQIPIRTFHIPLRTVLTTVRTFHLAAGAVHIAVGTVRIAVGMAHSAGGAVRGALREAVDGLDGGPPESVCFHQEDTMTRGEYEEHRRALEAQREADIAMINAAHEIRVRSLDKLWQAAAEDGADFTRPAAPGNGSLPAPAAIPAVSAPPAAARRKMRGRGEVLNDLDEAFHQLPEVFDKRDITRVLGYEPARATLFRALRQLMNEGAITMEDHSLPGTILTAFRKIRT